LAYLVALGKITISLLHFMWLDFDQWIGRIFLPLFLFFPVDIAGVVKSKLPKPVCACLVEDSVFDVLLSEVLDVHG
jgi:hypothetical protein